MVFRYPQIVGERRHGPNGYEDYRTYKPWLRDEFDFRCAYCLCRECWSPDGDDVFTVDHLAPRSKAPELECEYGNLVYACRLCNSIKQDTTGVPDPCSTPYGHSLEVLGDGTIRGLTPEGRALIQICRLDRPKLTAYRRGMIELFRDLQNRGTNSAVELRKRFFGFPPNLPNLSRLRPPGGNEREEGLTNSYYERQQTGALPEFY